MKKTIIQKVENSVQKNTNEKVRMTSLIDQSRFSYNDFIDINEPSERKQNKK